MNYKKIVLSATFLAIFAFSFSVTAPIAKAAGPTSLSDCMVVVGGSNMYTAQRIACIQNLIAQLQAQLTQLQAQENTGQSWCHTFNNNLRFGDTGSEVVSLVTALYREGLYNETISTINENVASAVVRFQEKYGILKTGYVGPITRAKLNLLYGCNNPVALQPSIKVISPNGGETYQVNGNGSIVVNWTTTGIMPLETIDLIRLRSYTSGQEYNLAYTVINDGQEALFIPNSVPTGSYILEMKTYKNNVLVFDASDSYFTIINSANQPSITVDKPNGTELYQAGTQAINYAWSANYTVTNQQLPISVLDVFNNVVYTYNLTYAINLPAGSYTPGSAGGFTMMGQSLTEGRYRIRICDTVANICGFSAYFTVSSSQPYLNITSPNGGESWKFGETHRITWASQGLDRVAVYVYNDTISGSGSTNYLDPAGTSLSIPSSQGYFDWTILQSWLPHPGAGNEGRYKISIGDVNAQTTGIRDVSDNYFNIGN